MKCCIDKNGIKINADMPNLLTLKRYTIKKKFVSAYDRHGKIQKFDRYMLNDKIPLTNFKRIKGIYGLFFNNELIYVGKTISFGKRIATHSIQKVFDSFVMLELPYVNSSELSIIEELYINKYIKHS